MPVPTSNQGAESQRWLVPLLAMSRVERPLEGAGGTIAELRLVADALDALPDQPSEAMERLQAAD